MKEIKIIDQYENELHTTIWPLKGRKKPKGIVQIIHGKNEHMKRYNEFAEYLNTLGLVVIGHDHLGHGLTATTTEYCHFGDELGFHRLYGGVQIVRDYIGENYPKIPVIMFAHSMGSFIGRYAILYDHKRYDMACFTGLGWVNEPTLSVTIGIANMIKKMKGATFISPSMTDMLDRAPNSMIKNGIINQRSEWITSDREIQKQVKNDPLCHSPFTITAQRDVLELIRATQNKRKIKESASSTAVFFISGEYDAMGDYGRVARKLYDLYRGCGYSNIKYSVLNGQRHEIINETEREHNYNIIGGWITNHLAQL